MTRIYVGTCSWSQHSNFYPAGLRPTDQISYYAQHFPVVEINATFYAMVSQRNYAAWAQRTPEGFVFDVKPFKQLTWHDRKTPPDEETTAAFREAMQPLRDAGKLGVVHYQFPPWYAYKPQNLDYIKSVRDAFQDRLSVEFRNRTWLGGDHVPALADTLRQWEVGLTVVDEPQIGSGSIPTLLEVTNPDLVLVRFHGRNYKKWYAKVKTTGERFDYLYSDKELEEWVPNVRQLAAKTQEIHLLFNNNAQDYAVRNAQQLSLMLRESLTDSEIVEPAK